MSTGFLSNDGLFQVMANHLPIPEQKQQQRLLLILILEHRVIKSVA